MLTVTSPLIKMLDTKIVLSTCREGDSRSASMDLATRIVYS